MTVQKKVEPLFQRLCIHYVDIYCTYEYVYKFVFTITRMPEPIWKYGGR